MESDDFYHEIYNLSNLILTYKKARKGKTKKNYVIEFEKNLRKNLRKLKFELMTLTYSQTPLKVFILRDPKTRKISKSAFRDRIVHRALVRIIEPILERGFIYDSCANGIRRVTLFALNRFENFKRKVTCNLKKEAFCFKADIKHYFREVNHEILLKIIKRKIKDEKIVWLIKQILKNFDNKNKGMSLGNLTSQFFANVYLNELDYFVKNILRAKYYVRYVDDFVILHEDKRLLENWMKEINKFLIGRLKIELHPEKSRIISLSKGIDFVGFRNFYYYRLLRKRNVKNMLIKVENYRKGEISKEKLLEMFQGWNAYAKWANSFKLRKRVVQRIYAKG